MISTATICYPICFATTIQPYYVIKSLQNHWCWRGGNGASEVVWNNWTLLGELFTFQAMNDLLWYVIVILLENVMISKQRCKCNFFAAAPPTRANLHDFPCCCWWVWHKGEFKFDEFDEFDTKMSLIEFVFEFDTRVSLFVSTNTNGSIELRNCPIPIMMSGGKVRKVFQFGMCCS